MLPTHSAVRRVLGLALLCLAAWSSLAARASLAQRPDADAGVMILDEGWLYRWGDSPLDERGVPVWAYDAQPTGWQPTSETFNPPGEGRIFCGCAFACPRICRTTRCSAPGSSG